MLVEKAASTKKRVPRKKRATTKRAAATKSSPATRQEVVEEIPAESSAESPSGSPTISEPIDPEVDAGQVDAEVAKKEKRKKRVGSKGARGRRTVETRKKVEDTTSQQESGMDDATAPADESREDVTEGVKRAPRRRGRRGGGKAAAKVSAGASQASGSQPSSQAKKAQKTTKVTAKRAEPAGAIAKSTGRKMLINVAVGDECRIAVIEKNRLEELFIERTSSQSHVGNIYKGIVTNIEPGIQAAFIDFGMTKNGFLHISDVQPQYFPGNTAMAEDVGRKIPRHQRPPIQKCFRRGQEVIVQVTKEGVGTKGPTLSTYLSIPGRFLVMMPGMSRQGVSRKIEDEDARRKMRAILGELALPSGIGFILRTAGLDRTKRELQRDLTYLQRLWKRVVQSVKDLAAPAELYRESDLVIRTIRDVYSADFDRVIVDDPETGEKVREFLQIAMPRTKTELEIYTDREPLFHRFNIEEEIERINMRHVPMASGGSLIIESTEAMVTIDVNSGRFRGSDDAEETAFRIDMEAADEIARQLRLRDLGGLIVCDFIDLRLERHKRAVEKTLRDALRKHKEKVRILRMSAFGLVEMTRQRQRPSIKRNLYADCTHCDGTGVVKMPESIVLDLMRSIQLAAHHNNVSEVCVTTAADVAFRVLNEKRRLLGEIETESGKTISIRGDATFTSDQTNMVCKNDQGHVINIGSAASLGERRMKR